MAALGVDEVILSSSHKVLEKEKGTPQHGVDILVIDDDVEISKLLVRIFQTEDYSVKVALSSEEGLRLIRELSPRLILLDIMLGQSSGWSICEALKKDSEYESFKHLNIIMFSVSRAQKDAEMARTYQVKDFIHKPFEIHDLLKRVERWVKKT